MIEIKKSLSGYTEYQFKELVKAILDAEPENQRDTLLLHFKEIAPHPAGTDLLYYPEPGVDDSPDGVTQTVQAWCLANGLPGLKPRF
ncbi:bacteriocin immunity protein [Stutzerimonas nitrititolerans]|uniref:bacteriocin immunity protein n=1 Tax=Stutzerimonas nitrititolerans TaxID=2482751 RepID=UPI00289F59C0|nr:bacteriocin immunity protein [Stutzerimonas nitrititolerans]